MAVTPLFAKKHLVVIAAATLTACVEHTWAPGLRCTRAGANPSGYRFGRANGHGRARALIPDLEEQAALAEIIRLRGEGRSLMAIRDAMRARGFPISHQLVANTIARHAAGTT